VSAADEHLVPEPLTLAEARRLFAPFDKEPAIAVAVSGGPDSTALLWLAAQWRGSRTSGPSLLSLTVDHGLRGESAGEAKAVQDFAGRLAVPHRILRWNGPKPATGIQEAARDARYALLAEAAREAGATCVMTAHTLDDQAETVLLRLLRGSGPAGLQAMAPISAYPGASDLLLARPFLEVSKARLIATLRHAGIPFAEDPSNRDPRHTRPRLRALMPTLAKEGLTAARLAVLSKRLQRAESALRLCVAQASEQVSLAPWGEGHRIAFDRQRFARLPEEIACRLLGQAIAHVGDEGPVELGKLETMFDALALHAMEKPDVAFRRTLAGAVVTLKRSELVVERAPPRRTPAKRPAERGISALTTPGNDPLGRSGNR